MMYPKKKGGKGNKHKHISNKTITEYVPCYICFGTATQTHEVYYGDVYLRNTSIKYGAQVPLCLKCHNDVHIYDKSKDLMLKKDHQVLLMNEHNWSVEDFRRIFYKNYLEED